MNHRSGATCALFCLFGVSLASCADRAYRPDAAPPPAPTSAPAAAAAPAPPLKIVFDQSITAAIPAVAELSPTAPTIATAETRKSSVEPPTRELVSCDEIEKATRIYSIGTRNILSFDEQATRVGEGGGLYIPIEGRNLDRSECNIQLRVNVLGTVPARYGADYDLAKVGSSKQTRSVHLTPAYLRRLRDGDRIEVQLILDRQRPAVEHVSPSDGQVMLRKDDSLLDYASRRFTVYTTKYYRENVLRRRVPAEDVTAFPLADEQIRSLFGPLVAERFFVVRLSVRNTTADDKLIKTGLITASGRAIVDSDVRTDDDHKFTVPVEVTPESAEQIYTILDDESESQTRSIVFRSLEFIGVLASAVTAAFASPADLVKGIGLFTGVAVPQGKKLYPDRWPGYLRNLVNYSMPDLVKVARNDAVQHRFLFFSKRRIQSLVGDQLAASEIIRGSRFGGGVTDVRVASLQFDALDVPFEVVVQPEEADARREVAELGPMVAALIARLEQIEGNWATRSPTAFSDAMSKKDWDTASALAAKVRAKQAVIPMYLQPLATAITQVVSLFDPDKGNFRPDLLENVDHGLKALRVLREEITRLSARLLGDRGSERQAQRVAQVRTQVTAAQALVHAYIDFAELLATPSTLKTLEPLTDDASLKVLDPKEGETTAVKKRLDMIDAFNGLLRELRGARGGASVPKDINFDPIIPPSEAKRS